MSYLKTLVALFCLFLFALLLIGIFLPKKTTVYYEAQVDCTPSRVFDEVNNLKNWSHWSYWFSLDPNIQLTYSDQTVGAGAQYSWKGNDKVQTGTLIIDSSVPNQAIYMTMKFGDYPPSKANFTIKPLGNGSWVHWEMDLNKIENPIMNFLFGGYQYIMANHFISSDYKKNIDNINSLCKGN